MSKILIVFRSTHGAIKAEKALINAAIACTVIPVPRHISAECGIAIEINEADTRTAHALLLKQSIPVAMYHENGERYDIEEG